MKKIRRTTALVLALVVLMGVFCSTAWAMEPTFVMPVPETASGTASEDVISEDPITEDADTVSEDVDPADTATDVPDEEDPSANLPEEAPEQAVVESSATITKTQDPEISLLALPSSVVKSGNYVAFIDRISVPDYAKTFYNSLVEASDGDGVDDWLIDVSKGELRNGENVIKVTTLEGSGFSTKEKAQSDIQTKFNTVSSYIRAVYDAFDRDHPEVFWLDGKTTTSVSYLYYSDGTYTATVYFKLKTSSFDVRKTGYTNATTIQNDIKKRDGYVSNIMSGATGKSDYYQVVQFNDWLTANNGYNTSSSFPESAFECLVALQGNHNNNDPDNKKGPVCEGYARAFKVLCDNAKIPCVLVDGSAINASGNKEDHMWNYVQIDSKWYGIDVTWNDPLVNGKDTTGRKNYFLAGSSTLYNGKTFIQSHPVTNQASSGGVQFKNGPALNSTAYTGTGSEDTKKSTSAWVVSLSPTQYVYNGSARKPAVTVRDGSVKLVEGTDYTISSWAQNTNVGTATVTVKGTGNYKAETKSQTFTITKADQSPAAQISVSAITVGNTAKIDVRNSHGKLSYSSSDTSIATVSSSGVITGVKAGTATITVKATDDANYNDGSTSFTVTIAEKSANSLLNAPALPTVSNTTSGIKITWTAVDGAAKYRVLYKTGSGNWATLADTTSTSYTWTKPQSGTTYKFTIACINSGGTSYTSNYDTNGTSIKFLTALKPTLANAASGVTVKWSKVTGASGYYIYRKTGTGSYKKIKTITSGKTVSYTDTAVKSKNGTKYAYAVKAYSGSTAGAYTGKTIVRLTTPTISSVKNSASKKMTVQWKKVSTANGYQIQYATSSSFSGAKTVSAAKNNIVSLNVSNLTKGKTYYVRMRTYKKVSGTTYYSAWTAKKSVKIAK